MVLNGNYFKRSHDSFLRQCRVNPFRWRWKDQYHCGLRGPTTKGGNATVTGGGKAKSAGGGKMSSTGKEYSPKFSGFIRVFIHLPIPK